MTTRADVIRRVFGGAAADEAVAHDPSLSEEISEAEAAELEAEAPAKIRAIQALVKSHPGLVNSPRPVMEAALRSQVLRDEMKERPNKEPISRDWLKRQADYWWDKAYRGLPGAGDRDIRASAQLTRFLHSPEAPHHAALLWSDPAMHGWLATLLAWAESAYPVVQYSSHRYAAALMSTAPPPDTEINSPWQSWMILLPTGILGDRRWVMVLRHPVADAEGNELVGDLRWSFYALAESTPTLHRWSQTTDDLRGKDLGPEPAPKAFPTSMSDLETDMDLTPDEQRTMILLSRLVLNTCLSMSDPRNMRPLGKHGTGAKSHRDGGAPADRVFEVGAPVTVDCREAVADYLSGKRRGPLTVQFLVRGHWTHQPFGERHSQRKLLWIEPYWKGPEDGPIRERPHSLNGPDPK